MGQKHHPIPSPPAPQVQAHPPAVNPELVLPPSPQPAPLPLHTVQIPNSGGNGMVWCSGPQAPGWNVSLPNGGCDRASSTSTVIHLSQLPYSGTNDLDIIFSGCLAIVLGLVVAYYSNRIKI